MRGRPQADPGRGLRRGGRRPCRRQGLSGCRLPDGLELQARCRRAELLGFRQLYPGCFLSLRPRRRRDDQVEEHRHGRRLSDPGGQPPDERLHGGCEGSGPGHQVPDRLHRLVVRSAQGQGNRLRPDRWRCGPALCRTFRRVRCGEGKERPGHRQCHRYPGGLSADRGRLRAVALRADAGQGDRGSEGRRLQGGRLWRLFLHEERRLFARAARHLRRQGSRRREGQGHREGKGDQGRFVHRRDQRRRAEIELAFRVLMIAGRNGWRQEDTSLAAAAFPCEQNNPALKVLSRSPTCPIHPSSVFPASASVSVRSGPTTTFPST
ncbi:protein of unknown function (plasmid) [Shinella sp. WSC3-e]|nr:protein of unknown function [Shinella sp. WSC3-e]